MVQVVERCLIAPVKNEGFAPWISSEWDQDRPFLIRPELLAIQPGCGGWGRLAGLVDHLHRLPGGGNGHQWA